MTRGDELPRHFSAVRWGDPCAGGWRPSQEACFGRELARRLWIEGLMGLRAAARAGSDRRSASGSAESRQDWQATTPQPLERVTVTTSR